VRTLVFIEDREGVPLPGPLGIVSKAARLGGEVAGVLCGAGVKAVAHTVASCGASRVYVADHPALAAPLPQPRVDVLARLIRERGFDTVLFETSALASDLAAGLAARLEAGVNYGLTDLDVRDGVLVGKRPALADSVLVEVGWKGSPRLAVMRRGSFEPVATGGRAEVEELQVEVAERSLKTVMVERVQERGETSIEDADVIVAGGRGVGGREGFLVLGELAQALGGAVAASLPAVEVGWCPASALVGQTGKTVTPRLYVACGISGAVQHKVAMERSGTIVAINTDRGAPIFDFCDLGVVGDLHEIVPRLTALVGERRSRPGRAGAGGS
jgi:electron transfer flavoprotein alpha subunit